MSTSTEVLYGQKELAEFCEYVIASLFDVNAPPAAQSSPITNINEYPNRQGIDTPPYTPPTSTTGAATTSAIPIKQPPVLVEFIAYALYRTRLPVAIVHQSLLLLSRLKQRYPSARGTSSSPHRLFLSSLMLSAKISMDDTYSNKSWSIVGSNFFSLREVNQMERELFAFLGWNVVASKEQLDEFVASAETAWQRVLYIRARESSKRRKLAEEEARHEQAKHAARALLRPHTFNQQAYEQYQQQQHQAIMQQQAASASSSSSSASSSASSSRASTSRSPPSSRMTGTTAPASMCCSSPAIVSSWPTSPTSTIGGDHSSFHPSYSSSASMSTRSSRFFDRDAGMTSASSSASTSNASSMASSAYPSATHSPSSPASAPLSAGPQTPDQPTSHYAHHDSEAMYGAKLHHPASHHHHGIVKRKSASPQHQHHMQRARSSTLTH